MNLSSLTLYALLCTFAYAATCTVALFVLANPAPRLRTAPARRHWQIVAFTFALLAFWRLGQGEMLVQARMRGWSHSHGLYDSRQDIQVAVTLMMVALAMVTTWVVTRHGLPSPSRMAMLAALGLLLFSVARLISLHALDSLLYRTGPFHLNYLFDLGPTALCAGLAMLELRRMPPPSSPRRRANR